MTVTASLLGLHRCVGTDGVYRSYVWNPGPAVLSEVLPASANGLVIIGTRNVNERGIGS